MTDEAYKRCTRCSEIKPCDADHFPRSKRSTSGWDSWCRACRSEYERERRQRNPEHVRGLDRARYERDRDDRAARSREYRREALLRDPDTKRREWYRQTAGVDLEYVEQLLADPCAYCGGVGGEIDHIVPPAEGGERSWTNLTGCCRSCNPSKGRKPVLLFLAHRNGCYEWRRDCP